ncbi:MAG: hypothetical protein IH624_12895 [Phycisphaerae bacterium]|nr:hypothetical protein [Phycisphaerae bacterium]
MYELLIRIETLYLQVTPVWLVGIGAVTVIVGLLFWLAGAYFSATIIGLLGAAVGSFCGMLVSQWLGLNLLIAMTIGAAAFCLAAVLFRNVIIIVLAVIIFAAVAGATYSSVVLSKFPALRQAQAAPFAMRSFSNMDPALRLAYVEQIAQAEAGFMERFNALLEDALKTMTPHKWKLLLSVSAGAVACLLLIWLLKNLVFALCYSLIGTLLLFIGTESLLMAVDVQLCSAIQEQRHLLNAAYYGMVGLGAVVQLIVMRSRKPKQNQEIERTRKLAAKLRAAAAN